jgi:hypothetical protein
MTDVAVDACCLINLLAADCVLSQPAASKKRSKGTVHPDEVASLGLVLHVPTIVANESLYILKTDQDDSAKLLKSPIDLEPYFSNGILQRCDIEGEHETAYFVGYASRLDDGEAACVALAKSRGWMLATDDRPATTLALQQGVPVLTTAELLKRWATVTKATKAEVSTALSNIQRFAKFVPRLKSPEAHWWLSYFSHK